MTELQVTEIINVINLTVIDQTTTTDYEITEVVETIHLTITEKFGSDGLPGPPGPASTVPGPKGDPGTSITKTSELTNDGEDGMHPFITAEDLIPIQIPDFTQHGPITTTSNSVTIGLSELGENFAMIAGVKYIEPTTNPETPKPFTAVTTGNKVLIIEAQPDADVFHLVEGEEGSEAKEPTYTGLFIARLIVSTTGVIVENSNKSVKLKEESDWRYIEITSNVTPIKLALPFDTRGSFYLTKSAGVGVITIEGIKKTSIAMSGDQYFYGGRELLLFNATGGDIIIDSSGAVGTDAFKFSSRITPFTVKNNTSVLVKLRGDVIELLPSGAGGTNNSDTIAKTIEANLTDLGVMTEEEVTPQIIADYFNSLGLVKSEKDFYIIKVTTPEPVFNFDVTGNWNLTTDENGNPTPITDALSFKTWLESGWTSEEYDSPNSFEDVVVSDFSLVGGRLTANVTTSGGNYFALEGLEITQVNSVSTGDFTTLGLYGNQITNFNPIIALPTGLQTLYLDNNQIINFNPTIALPTGLKYLYLGNNQIINFNPTIALPTGLKYLYLGNNQITNFNPTIALPTGLQTLYLDNNQIINFNPTIALPTGLQALYLGNNQITNFNPTIALPSGLQLLYLNGNQIITFNPTIALPTGLYSLFLNGNQIITFNPTIALPTGLQTLDLGTNQITNWSLSEPWANSLPNGTTIIVTHNNLTSSNGTTFKSILTGKGYTVNS